MKHLTTTLLLLLVLTGLRAQDHTLWYRRPAPDWLSALPLGNGHLGAMLYGGTDDETLWLNDDTFWSGSPHDNLSPEALTYLPRVRQLIFDGREEEAAQLIDDHIIHKPWGQRYLDSGRLTLHLHHADTAQYRRDLQLANATAHVDYQSSGIHHQRTAFASLSDGLLVVHLEASRRHALAFTLAHHSARTIRQTAHNNTLTVLMQGDDHEGAKGGLECELRIEVETDGRVAAEGDSLAITGARRATLRIVSATNYVNYHDITASPTLRNDSVLAAARRYTYAQLLQRHTEAYQRQYRRMTLSLPRSQASTLPTDERLAAYAGGEDHDFVSLMLQYARYLLISSSQPGTQPANLQGIWNNKPYAPWDSKYTTNINLEMNYWPAEPLNLSETAQPLFALIDDLSHTGGEAARRLYGCDGWVQHHNTDLWRIAGPIEGSPWGIFNAGGAWLATHLWQHYLYTADRDFLSRHYDAIAGTARFYLSFLQRHPRLGYLVTAPSESPEHGPVGKQTNVTAGCTMDNQIVFDALSNTLHAAEVLGRDTLLQRRIREALPQLPPMQIGRYGQLQEWLTDGDNPTSQHRHISHLYGLYPSNQISPYTHPELFAAAYTTLLQRGDMATGWSLGWKTCFWARMLDGDHALRIISNMLHPLPNDEQTSQYPEGRTYPNLFDAHPPFQIDGNFGVAAGIAELLLQSHDGALHLLPALPTAWAEGQATGLRARGGYTVSLTWRDHQLAEATIRASLTDTLRLRSYTPLAGLTPAQGPCPNALLRGADIKQPMRTADPTAVASRQPQSLRTVYEYDIPLQAGESITVRP